MYTKFDRSSLGLAQISKMKCQIWIPIGKDILLFAFTIYVLGAVCFCNMNQTELRTPFSNQLSNLGSNQLSNLGINGQSGVISCKNGALHVVITDSQKAFVDR